MLRAKEGDADAFGELYDRHGRLALGITRRICGSDLAEDAAQTAFLSAWRARGTYSPEHGSFRSWICRICRNRALDVLRARRTDAPDDPEELGRHLGHEAPSAVSAPDLIAERSDDGEEMRTALHRLPTAQREVIVLAYFGGLTHSEISETLGLPAGTVKGRMRLGLSRLRRDPHVQARWPDPTSAQTRNPDAHPLQEDADADR